jgi:hypothetical protein
VSCSPALPGCITRVPGIRVGRATDRDAPLASPSSCDCPPVAAVELRAARTTSSAGLSDARHLVRPSTASRPGEAASARSIWGVFATRERRRLPVDRLRCPRPARFSST